MKNKPADVPYCGVRENVIKKTKPTLNETNFKRLHQFITRRYLIHKRKDVHGLPKPWTVDPILQQFKFTNVRREHDRETKWVLNNIVNHPTLSYDNKLMNLILYRLFNKSSTLELLSDTQYPVINGKADTSNPMKGTVHFPITDAFERRARRRLEEAQELDKNYTYFTNAFLTCGLKVSLGRMPETNDEFMPMRVIKFARKLWNEGIIYKIKKAKSQKAVYDVLKSQYGIGEFLAYQMFVDFTYIDEFPFSENEFTVAGPGCIRGLKYIFDDFDGMTYDEALFWLRDNIDFEFSSRDWKWEPFKLFDDLPEHDRYMNVMSLENCHCEISKYIRALDGTGRPKNKYKGV